MPTKFPGEIDTFVNPSAGSPLTNPPHAQQHTDENDAIVAIQEALGTNPQGSSATVNARVTKIETDLTGPAGGDLTGNYPDPLLKDVLAQDAGTYGSSTDAVVLNVDSKGRILSIETQPISGGGGADINAPYLIWKGVEEPPYLGFPNSKTLTTDGDVFPVFYTESDYGDDPITYGAVKLELKGFGSGGTFGNSTNVPQITVDTKGRVVAVTEVPISGGGGGGGTADDISGGVAGNLLYQQATSDTAFVTNGTSGQVLLSNGSGMPTWANQSSLSVGSATNKPGGTAGQILYQSGPGVTSFVGPGSSTQVLVSNGASASGPFFKNQNELDVRSAASATLATNLSGSATQAVVYQASNNTTNFLLLGSSEQVLKVSGTSIAWGSVNLASATAVGTSILQGANGGTGINNSGKTITIGGGNFSTTGTGTLTFNTTAATNVTLPTSGTLVPTNGTGASGTWGIHVTGTAAGLAGGANKQIPIQSTFGTTFVPAPTAAGQVLTASGASLTVGWSAPTGVTGSGTVKDLAIWSSSSSIMSLPLALVIATQSKTSWGFHEDFVGVNGTTMQGTRFISEASSGSSVSQAQTSESGNELGVMRLSIGTGVASKAVIVTSDDGVTFTTSANQDTVFIARIFISSSSDATNRYVLRSGFGSNTGDTGSFGSFALFFEYNSAVHPNWLLKKTSLGSTTTTTTSVAVQFGVWIELKIATLVSGLSFYIDEVNVGTVGGSGSGSSASSSKIIPLQMIRTSVAGNAERVAYIDYCAVSFTGLSR